MKEMFDSFKNKLLAELNETIANKVDEEVRKVKAELRSELENKMQKKDDEHKQEIQKLQDENNKLHQTIAKSEGERLSTKILLSGSSVPAFCEGESTLTIAHDVLKNQLNVIPQGRIINATRFGSSTTRDGRQAKPRILVEVDNVQ